jgi:signal peptidase I
VTALALAGTTGLLGLVAGAWWRLRRLFLVLTVVGPSMSPAFAAGDHVLVRRRRLDQVRSGAVVAVRLPPPAAGPRDRRGAGTGPELMIKRAVAVPGDPVPPGVPVPDARVPPQRLVVLGDNQDRSHDSRVVGYVPADAVLGVVVRRLHQAGG